MNPDELTNETTKHGEHSARLAIAGLARDGKRTVPAYITKTAISRALATRSDL